MPSPEHVPQPLERDEDALVENMYAVPANSPNAIPGVTDLIDYDSALRTAEYLESRHVPDPEPIPRVIYVQTGYNRPAVVREVVDVKRTTRIEHDGWLHPLLSPKFAAAVTIAGLAVLNGESAVLDTVDEVKQVGHKIHRVFDPIEDTTITVIDRVPAEGPTRKISVDIQADNTPGSAEVNPEALSKFRQKADKVVRKGGKIISIIITGRSSDEYGTNDSIGKAESPENDYSDERATSYADAVSELRDQYPSIFGNAKIEVKVDQNVLTPAQKQKVSREASNAGFTGKDNIVDAINAVANGDIQDGKLKRLVDKLFTSKRGVTIDATAKMPGMPYEKEVKTTQRIPGEDNPPSDPDRDYTPFIWPLILPRLKRVDGPVKDIKKFKLIRKPVYKPVPVRDRINKVWVKFRKDAINEDMTARQDVAAYTHKYEHIFRDGNIKDVLRADFKNAEGEDKAIRVLFMDQSLPPYHPDSDNTEPIDNEDNHFNAFGTLLRRFPSMQGGKIADRVAMIAVYNSDNASTLHNDPKKLGLGVDKQSPSNILGTYTPFLNLVELHMPETWDPEELEAMFESFDDPRWTIAHEVSGHGTDDTDQELVLVPAHASGIPDAYYVKGDPWARRMRPLQTTLLNLRSKLRPVRFDVEYSVLDINGNPVKQRVTGVKEGDHALTHASHAEIVGLKPTIYAGSDREHYAETAAAVTTGKDIPFTEAGVIVPVQPGFADGYRPDVRGQKLFTDSVGAIPGAFPVEFKNPVEVQVSHVAPENDAFVREQMLRTRTIESPLPEDMATVLTTVTQRQKSERR